MKRKAYLVFRILTSSIFIYAGINHLLRPEKITQKVSTGFLYKLINNNALFDASIIASGIVMATFGILLSFGYRQKLSALVLLALIVPITLIAQLQNIYDLGPFFKNVAIIGSLILIINHNQNAIQNPSLSYGVRADQHV